MQKTVIYFFLLCSWVFSLLTCTQFVDKENNEIQAKILTQYVDKYRFSSEPIYDPIYDDFYQDTLHRYYWLLEQGEVEYYLEKFSKFDKESLLSGAESINYLAFGIVFNRKGHILSEGFLDDLYSFTGINYSYNKNWRLMEKHYSKLDQNFYEVKYKLNDDGIIQDSTYQYYVIVIPDKDTFQGPELTICVEYQIILDTRKYDYKDFFVYYYFFDTQDTGDTKSMIDNETIYKGQFKNSSDGLFYICHDLELKFHLVMSFGIFVEKNVSDQDLTLGTIFGPIINKNIDSHEL